MGRINIAKIALMLLIIGLFLFISGCVNSPKENITPTPNTPPKAAASASPSSIYEGDTVSFNGLSSIDSDGSIASYQWNFGDGETKAGATLFHKYSNAGTYTALLTVVDEGGLKDTDSIKIIVNPKPTPTPIIQATTAKTDSSKKTVKIIDFVPRKGEIIADLSLEYEVIKSGSNKTLGIDYYPEDITVWGNNLVIWGMRFLNNEDANKEWLHYDRTKWRIESSFSDWERLTRQSKDLGEDYPGMWENIAVKKDEYVLLVAVNGDKVPYAREKAEVVMKILIDRYNAALW